MNEVFVIGEIVSKVDFKFIYKGKNTSKAKCNVQLNNGCIIEIIGYDEIADFMYKHIKEKQLIFAYGKLNNSGRISVYKLKFCVKNKKQKKYEIYRNENNKLKRSL